MKKGNHKNITIITIIIILAAVIIFKIVFSLQQKLNLPQNTITNFSDCVNAGYPVGESYPRQCWTPDGRGFVENLKQAPPVPGQITISGEIACLPKKGTGPQTMECAIGLKDQEGRYYGLKNLSQIDPDYKFSAGGKQVEVSGILNTEQSTGPDGNKYDTVGTIEVSSIIDLSPDQGSSVTEDFQESSMSELEARAIAEKSCIKGGQAISSGNYNPNSKTWWFDANLNSTKPGCSPACVVFEETGATEINWRCTGLIPR